MERRILPHQHHVDVARKVDPAAVAGVEMVALDPLDGNRRGMRGDAPMRGAVAFIGEGRDVVVPYLEPACLRRQHQRKRAVARDIDVFERVHLDGDA